MTGGDRGDAEASRIVEQFGDEIRAAIQAVAEETPRVAGVAAKSAAKDEMRKEIMRTTVRWYLTSVAMTVVISSAVCWLILTYSKSKQDSVHFEVRYEGTTAACERGPDTPDGRPVVVCHPVP